MPTFRFTGNDGVSYDVEADTPDKAAKDFGAFRQDQMNQAFVSEADKAPFWAKPFMAGSDVGRVGIDTITQGWGDRFADYMKGNQESDDTEAMKTKAARNRMGWAGTAAEAATLAGALPTAVPKVVGMVGGGPAIRTGVAALTGATEGGALGTVNALGHKEDPTTGGVIGAATGGAMPLIGGLLNKGAQKFNELRYGQSYTPPPYNITTLGKSPDRMQRVNVATTKAQDKSRTADNPLAEQSAYRSEFAKIPPRQFTPAQKEMLDQIVRGDFGTKASGKLGEYISDKLVAAGAMAGAGGWEGAGLAGLLTAGGHLLKKGSLGGTKEAAQNLRRSVYGYPQPPTPFSPNVSARTGAVARQLGLEANRDEEVPWLPGYFGR